MRRWLLSLLAVACADVGAPPASAIDSSAGDTGDGAPGRDTDAGQDSGGATRPPSGPAPAPADDRFAASADTMLALAADAGVLGNDAGEQLVVVAHDGPTAAGGWLELGADGRLRYTPPPAWGGCDRSDYTVVDAQGRAAAAVITFAVHRRGTQPSPIALEQAASQGEAQALLPDDPGERLGDAVAILGDMNGDGLAEVAIAAPGASPRGRLQAGRVWIVPGSDARGVASPAALPADGVLVIDGDLSGARVGERLAPAGDVDGDGLADLILGAPRTNLGDGPMNDHVGRVFVVFGRATGGTLDLQALLSPADGHAYTGEFMGDFAGSAIAGAGDLDGDGLDDILVGAPLWGPGEARPGRVYVVFSRPDAGSWRLDQMLASGHALAIDGDGDDDQLGRVLAGVGDLDGDGDREIAIGMPGWSAARGRVWIVDGPIGGGALAAMAADERAYALDGDAEGDAFGGALAALGDGDGNGHAELAIAAAGAAAGRGRVWVLDGTAMGPDGAGLGDAWAIDGEADGEALGTTLAAAGDLDGDGHGDLWIGAGLADGGAGRVYAVRLHAADEPGLGAFTVHGRDGMGSGRALAGGADIDGDGIPDVVIGSPGAAVPTAYSGRADVVRGDAVICE